MEWYEAEVREMERARLDRPAVHCPVVFYGSSSIRLWESLAADLGEPDAVNAGFGGSTLAACAHFFDRLVAPLAPRSLVVYAGDNDLGDGRHPWEVLESFRQLLAKTRVPLWFLSIKLSPARWGLARRIRETNEAIREEIQRHASARFVDMSPGMVDRDGRPLAAMYLEDGLHLSAAGYRVWAGLLKELRNDIFTPNCGKTALSFGTDEPGVSQVVQPSPEP